mgnify:FL=1
MIDHYSFTPCRTLGHSWDPRGVSRWAGFLEGGGSTLTLVCLRCACERTDDIGASGVLASRKYRYNDNYAHDKQTRTEWRADLIAELLKKGRRK